MEPKFLGLKAADIVYNSARGGLFYNQNGTATGCVTGGQFLFQV